MRGLTVALVLTVLVAAAAHAQVPPPGTDVRVTGVPTRNGLVASAIEATAIYASPAEPLP